MFDLSCAANTEGLGYVITPGTPDDVTTDLQPTAGGYIMWEAGMAKLWGTPANRGENRLIPGLTGRRRYGRRIDQRQVECPMTFQGTDPDDPSAAMRAVWDDFYDAVVAPVDDAATREILIVSKDGARARQGEVTIEDLTEDGEPQYGPGWVVQDAILVVTIHDGRLPEITPPGP